MTRLGSYEIVRKLARGGMAELFIARTIGPEGFAKLVVLKMILPSYAQNPRFVRLFLDEAKLAATLDHAHIAQVYDMGKVEGHYFFTMEYVHGQDVRATLRRSARMANRFPIDHAVQIAHNVAAALHYAHERRRADGTFLDIVHRDVSPSNILVSYDGAVKLVDFGVAKAATSTVKTRTGTLKGKVSYMSPEQAKGAPIDRRSDIFALGIVLWEMVTAQRLFKSDNDLATIQRIINSTPPPPSELRPDCPHELDRIVLRALANNIEERYQTAEQLFVDLAELARDRKLEQSSVALRTWMHELFAEEIDAWNHAHASGKTLTEHLGTIGDDMTTQVSESELDPYDDDNDSEVDQDADQMQTLLSPHQAPPQLIPLPGLDLDTTLTQKATVTVDLRAPSSAPPPLAPSFPVAPPEWRPSLAEPPAHGPDPNELRKRHILIGASIAFGLLVLVAIAVGRNGPAKAEPPPSAPSRVEMKSEPVPTPVETAPAAAPATHAQEPAAGP